METFAPVALGPWLRETGAEYRWCPIIDAPVDGAHQDIVERLNEAAAILDAWDRAERVILVHCQAGLSRSVSAVILYLMRHQSYSGDEAFALIRAQRPRAYPDILFELLARMAFGQRITRGDQPGCSIYKRSDRSPRRGWL